MTTKDVKITVYSTATCPHCMHAKDFLKSEGIDFKSIDVGEDDTAREEMVAKSGQMGVPVIKIEKDGEEHFVVGFNKAKLQSLLEA